MNSITFIVPSDSVNFWEMAASSPLFSPFVERCVSNESRHYRGNWEVHYADGVRFNVCATISNGSVRFVGEAWKLPESVREPIRYYQSPVRKSLLGTYRVEIEGNVYEVILREE